jgi:plastocyanin
MGRHFVTIIFFVMLLMGVSLFLVDPSLNIEFTGNPIVENVENNEMPKVFVFTGENFKFISGGVENPEIRVSQGDKVRIEFLSTGGFHDWVLNEFDARTMRVNDDGERTSVEFIADKKGAFEYYCSVGSHRSLGMKGVFVVE